MRAVIEAGLIVCAIGIVVCAAIMLILPNPAPPSPPPRRCTYLPTETVAWGIFVQNTPDGLYTCFQQGAGSGITNVTCVPMVDCRP